MPSSSVVSSHDDTVDHLHQEFQHQREVRVSFGLAWILTLVLGLSVRLPLLLSLSIPVSKFLCLCLSKNLCLSLCHYMCTCTSASISMHDVKSHDPPCQFLLAKDVMQPMASCGITRVCADKTILGPVLSYDEIRRVAIEVEIH